MQERVDDLFMVPARQLNATVRQNAASASAVAVQGGEAVTQVVSVFRLGDEGQGRHMAPRPANSL
ncbi:MAG: hypothetical protein I8H87_01840 [Comamonadaceae bacterium]|nr:hypothetical protein [Comamonadaceae bacterium]